MRLKQDGQGRWILDVRAWVGGRELRKRLRFTGNRRDAVAKYHDAKRRLIARAETSRSLTPLEAGTFGDAVKAFCANRELDPDSQWYLATLTKDIGATPLAAMREKWLAYLPLLRKRKSRYGRPLSNATCNLYYRWARAAIGAYLGPGVRNPLAGLQQLPVTPRDRVLTEAQRDNLLQAIGRKAPHLLPVCTFLLSVPCRLGEVLAMRTAWVNVFTWTIDVPAGVTKGGLPCSKPIPPALRDYFADLVKAKQSEYCFYRKRGGQCVPLKDFHHVWRDCCDEAGITDYRIHDTRHDSATALTREGWVEREVMEVAAWKTPMLSTYFHRDPKRTAARIAAAWTAGNRTAVRSEAETKPLQVATA